MAARSLLAVMLWSVSEGLYMTRGNDTVEHSSLSTLKRTSRQTVTCYGPLACYCYSRATQRHFCCKCVDETCFPQGATVHLENGTHLPIQDLRLGHKILATNSKGNLVFSPVIAFLERRPKIYGTYLIIKTTSGHEILISPNHLVFSVRDNNKPQSRFAEQIRVGDHVFVPGNESCPAVATVTAISREVRKGAYVPLTSEGSLFVGGVLASCYASVSDHWVAHVALTPVRVWPSLFETPLSQMEDGVRGYVRLLQTLARWLLPSNIQGMLTGQIIWEIGASQH